MRIAIFASLLALVQASPIGIVPPVFLPLLGGKGADGTIAKAPVSIVDEMEHYWKFCSVSYCVGMGKNDQLYSQVRQPFVCNNVLCADQEFSQTEVLYSFYGINEHQTANGYIAVDHKRKQLVLVFRGTQSEADSAADLNTWQVPNVNFDGLKNTTGTNAESDCQGCSIHAGFVGIFNNSFKAIDSRLNLYKAQYPDYKLVVTGHSLGGAVALLYGISLRVNGRDPLVVTFGQPRVGNEAFANYVDSLFFPSLNDMLSYSPYRKMYRVTRYEDPVTQVPFWDGYTQQSGEVFINQFKVPTDPENVLFCQGQNNRNCANGIPWYQYANIASDKSVHSSYFFRSPSCSNAQAYTPYGGNTTAAPGAVSLDPSELKTRLNLPYDF
uniref:triacylglycerol lipase n=1 Tax=Yarrowia alimentaria TaxID=479092 RepID=A0A078BNQ6_9ASCO|nr:lipase [Yarrowia alimentaria]